MPSPPPPHTCVSERRDKSASGPAQSIIVRRHLASQYLYNVALGGPANPDRGTDGIRTVCVVQPRVRGPLSQEGEEAAGVRLSGGRNNQLIRAFYYPSDDSIRLIHCPVSKEVRQAFKMVRRLSSKGTALVTSARGGLVHVEARRDYFPRF